MFYIEKDLKRYKLKTNEAGLIFDPIRKLYLKPTPEEIVRQRVLKYLINRMKVPQSKIVVESGLSNFGVTDSNKHRRIDIGFYGAYNDLAAIVECKAYSIRFAEAPYSQAIEYVRAIKLPTYFVTDGIWLDGYSYFYDTNQFVPIESIPLYDELCV